MRHPRGGGAVVVALALVAGLVVTAAPAGAAPTDSAAARAQAASIATEVERLRTRAEIATERYNGLQDKLAGVVTESIQASERLDALNGMSSASQDDATRRISAIYRSGGGLSLYATVLDGSSPNDMMSRLYTVQSIVGGDQDQVDDLTRAVRDAAATKARVLELSNRRTLLAAEAEQARTEVVTLLADAEAALKSANADVTRLVAEEEARRQAAAEAAAQVQLTDVGALTFEGDVAPGNPYAEAAIAAARSKVGLPYVWGGTGPNGYDCSGLLYWAYGRAGLPIMRVAADQARTSRPVPLAQIAPGDFISWATDPSRPSTIHHIAMYIGDGKMIEAPHTGAFVRVVPIRLGPEFAGITRPGLG